MTAATKMPPLPSTVETPAHMLGAGTLMLQRQSDSLSAEELDALNDAVDEEEGGTEEGEGVEAQEDGGQGQTEGREKERNERK